MASAAQRSEVVKQLEDALAAMTPEERTQEVFNDGERSWTAQQILEEVKGRTPFGEGILESHLELQKLGTSGG